MQEYRLSSRPSAASAGTQIAAKVCAASWVPDRPAGVRDDSEAGRPLRAIAAMLCVLAFASAAGAQDVERGRRLFLEKADCQYCHGWAGDGAGAPQSPGGAANLRRSQLARD